MPLKASHFSVEIQGHFSAEINNTSGESLRVSTKTGQSQSQSQSQPHTTWLIERHGFMTPAAYRQQQLEIERLAA
jgi:hypothetical protein